MKRIIKAILTAFIITGLAASVLACGDEPDETEAVENQIVTVERGDLSVEITAVGNLAFSRSEDLAFDLFYYEGTVEEVLVEEGDIVTEGQALASIDTEEWEDELEELEDSLTDAERSLTTKERALVTAERKVITLERTVADKEDAVISAERQVTAEELDLSQAQLDLDTAEYNLSEIDEVKEAQDAIDEAEWNLELARMGLTGNFNPANVDYNYWYDLKVLAETQLTEAKADLQEILTDNGIILSKDVALEVADKQLRVKQKELALEDAQLDVVDAEKAVDDAKYALETAKLDVEDAEHDVEDAELDIEEARKALLKAQEKLDEANSKSPLIVALFDGFITKVNVEGGDEVLSGTVAVQLADPDQFEAEIMVSEMDISQIEEEGEAWVQVDAISGLTLPAKVTHISPTSTISQGVVNYKVKVELASFEEMMQEQQAARQEAMQQIQEGELPEHLQQAIEEGSITREQAEEMVELMQQGQGMPQGQAMTITTEDFKLREGLTVTVTIVVEEAAGVLLVPNTAITSRAGKSYVQVVSPDGTIEERVIQTGISDWQFTEVTEGLSEGEQVVVPQGTTTTTPSAEQGPRGGAMFFGPPPR
jgi:multidrug efflux pump subunit AcrA (membrane-fusion protein)